MSSLNNDKIKLSNLLLPRKSGTIKRLQLRSLPKCLFSQICARKVGVGLPGKENSKIHGARPVHRIITMIEWIRTSRLPINITLSGMKVLVLEMLREGVVLDFYSFIEIRRRLIRPLLNSIRAGIRFTGPNSVE